MFLPHTLSRVGSWTIVQWLPCPLVLYYRACHVLVTFALLDSSDEEVTKVLQTFIQTSILGDFSLRIHLLRAFCHTPASKQQLKHALNAHITRQPLYHSDSAQSLCQLTSLICRVLSVHIHILLYLYYIYPPSPYVMTAWSLV